MIQRANRGGCPPDIDVRELLNGIIYVLSAGCRWRYVPNDMPPRSTLNRYFQRRECDGTLHKIHDKVY